jgi:hypothetical protein
LAAAFGITPTFCEGDEPRVVLVGAQERIVQHLGHAGVVCGPGVLQPFEHLLRLLAQGIDLGDLAALDARVRSKCETPEIHEEKARFNLSFGPKTA